MKKVHYVFLFISLVLIAYSCRKEFAKIDLDTSFTVEDAKAYIHDELGIKYDKIV